MGKIQTIADLNKAPGYYYSNNINYCPPYAAIDNLKMPGYKYFEPVHNSITSLKTKQCTTNIPKTFLSAQAFGLGVIVFQEDGYYHRYNISDFVNNKSTIMGMAVDIMGIEVIPPGFLIDGNARIVSIESPLTGTTYTTSGSDYPFRLETLVDNMGSTSISVTTSSGACPSDTFQKKLENRCALDEVTAYSGLNTPLLPSPFMFYNSVMTGMFIPNINGCVLSNYSNAKINTNYITQTNIALKNRFI